VLGVVLNALGVCARAFAEGKDKTLEQDIGEYPGSE